MTVLLACGLALFAFAHPQERLVGEAFAGRFEQSPLWVIWHRLGLGLGRALGAQGEQVRFALAAAAYGACLPAALHLVRRGGARFPAALVGAAIVLFSPTAWIAGTTPGTTSIALLLSLLLARCLVGAHAGRPRTSLLLWALLVGVQVSNLLLWPALVAAHLAPPAGSPVPATRRARATLSFGGLAVLTLAVAVLAADWDPLPLPVEFEPGATRWRPDPNAWQRFAAALPGLGAALLGLVAGRLAQSAPRAPDATGEPAARGALRLWILLPVTTLACSSVLTWDASFHWLLAPACLGWGRLIASPRFGSARQFAGSALVAQFVLAGAFQSWIDRGDPAAPWRERARAQLEANDTVITGHITHAYLAAHRLGLRSVFLRAADSAAPSPDQVEGVYADPGGLTNLRIKTQDAGAWAQEGVEARGFGFRPVLDRPFPRPSEGIGRALERELQARVEYLPFDSVDPAE